MAKEDTKCRDKLSKENYFELANGDFRKDEFHFGEYWKDPDECCKKLYEDLACVFFNEKNLKKLFIEKIAIQRKSSWSFIVQYNDTDYYLSSDYIGASINCAATAGLSEKEIKLYLEVSRTIGGHMIFPKGKEKKWTVNQARGCVPQWYDRFDLALDAFKKWFFNRGDSKIKYAIENYSDWFELFEKIEGNQSAFRKFITFFKLDDFVSENDEVIDLVNSDLKNGQVVYLDVNDKEQLPNLKDHELYLRYVSNSNSVISKRTDRLLNQ